MKTEAPTKRDGPLTWLARRSRRLWVLLVTVGLPAVYMLNLGMLAFLDGKGLLPASSYAFFQLVYWPLGWLTTNGPPILRTLLRGYWDFCHDGFD